MELYNYRDDSYFKGGIMETGNFRWAQETEDQGAETYFARQQQYQDDREQIDREVEDANEAANPSNRMGVARRWTSAEKSAGHRFNTEMYDPTGTDLESDDSNDLSRQPSTLKEPPLEESSDFRKKVALDAPPSNKVQIQRTMRLMTSNRGSGTLPLEKETKTISAPSTVGNVTTLLSPPPTTQSTSPSLIVTTSSSLTAGRPRKELNSKSSENSKPEGRQEEPKRKAKSAKPPGFWQDKNAVKKALKLLEKQSSTIAGLLGDQTQNSDH